MGDIYKTLMVSEETKPHIQDYIDSSVWVETAGDAAINGENLINAYEKAKTLTPNGAALSATNRACVIVPPGKYDLDHGVAGACVPLTLDTQYVDIIGLTTDRSLQHIYGTPEATNSGVIVQTANDVHISNLTVEILTAFGEPAYDNTDSAAYFPSTNLSNTVIDNCCIKGDIDNSQVLLWSTRTGIEYSGTYINSKFDDLAFGNDNTIASGTYINCIGGIDFCGGDMVASGTFTSCTGGTGSFGGTASGTFISCTGGAGSFGGERTASGTFTSCTGGTGSFGTDGIPSGIFSFCSVPDAFPTPVASVATITLVAGGTGYTANDELTVVGGTGTAATIKVLTVNAGVILTAEILTVGAYTVEPENAVAVTGGTGNNDATFDLTWHEGHIYGCIDNTGFIAEVNWNDGA